MSDGSREEHPASLPETGPAAAPPAGSDTAPRRLLDFSLGAADGLACDIDDPDCAAPGAFPHPQVGSTGAALDLSLDDE